jgi:hypothetical protein
MANYRGGICLCQAKNLTFFRLTDLKSLRKQVKQDRKNLMEFKLATAGDFYADKMAVDTISLSKDNEAARRRLRRRITNP